MSFIDTVMVGRLGGNELAGIALGSTFFNFLLIFCMGILFSLAPIVSQAKGAGKPQDGIIAVRHGLLLAVTSGDSQLCCCSANSPAIFGFMRQQPIAADLASAYLRAGPGDFCRCCGLYACVGF